MDEIGRALLLQDVFESFVFPAGGQSMSILPRAVMPTNMLHFTYISGQALNKSTDSFVGIAACTCSDGICLERAGAV